MEHWAVTPSPMERLIPYCATQPDGSSFTVRLPVEVPADLPKNGVVLGLQLSGSLDTRWIWPGVSVSYHPATGFHEVSLPRGSHRVESLAVGFTSAPPRPYFVRSRLLHGGSVLTTRLAAGGVQQAPEVQLVPALSLSGGWDEARSRIDLRSTPEPDASYYVFRIYGVLQPRNEPASSESLKWAGVAAVCIWDGEAPSPRASVWWSALRRNVHVCLEQFRHLTEVQAAPDAGADQRTKRLVGLKRARLLLYGRAEAWDAQDNPLNASPRTLIAEIDEDRLRGLLFRPERRDRAPHKPLRQAAACTVSWEGTRPVIFECPQPLSGQTQILLGPGPRWSGPLEGAQVQLWLDDVDPPVQVPRPPVLAFTYDEGRGGFLSYAAPGAYLIDRLNVLFVSRPDDWYFARSRLKHRQWVSVGHPEDENTQAGRVDLVKALSVQVEWEGAGERLVLSTEAPPPSADRYVYRIWLHVEGQRPPWDIADVTCLGSGTWILAQRSSSSARTVFRWSRVLQRARQGWSGSIPYLFFRLQRIGAPVEVGRVVQDAHVGPDEAAFLQKVRVIRASDTHRFVAFAQVEAWDRNHNLLNLSPLCRIGELDRAVFAGVEFQLRATEEELRGPWGRY